MTTGLYKRKKTNGLAEIISKVTSELTSPFILYFNYRRNLSEGKINLRLNYLKRKGELGYERKLNGYAQELESKLQEPEISENMFEEMNKGIQYFRQNYDWEKEKRQINTIGRGIKSGAIVVGRGVEWAGRKTKAFAQKELQKEKEIMKERAKKIKIRMKKIQRQKKEKLFLKFNKLKKDMTQMNTHLSELNPERNCIYINNLKWRRNKLYKNFENAEDKLRKGGYPI